MQPGACLPCARPLPHLLARAFEEVIATVHIWALAYIVTCGKFEHVLVGRQPYSANT